MVKRRAINVFPSPVGSTTRVFLFFVVSKIDFWYSLGLRSIMLVERYGDV